MSEKRETRLKMDDQYDPWEFQVTPDFNEQYLFAEQDYSPIYFEETELGPPAVHPSLLLNQSNLTRSPSFRLPPKTAAVHTMDEVEFLSPGRVGKKFRVTWKMLEEYEKRGRHYGVLEALIVDEDGLRIMRRVSHNTLAET